MYSDWVLFTLGAVIFVWLGFLTYQVFQEKDFLKELFPEKGERDIRQKFKELVKLNERLEKKEKLDLKHIQRVALLRYNPYGDTGGDMSFSIALLDDQGMGVVLTSLHSRSGTRVFAKDVVLGKPEKHGFSKEEEEVVKIALKS